MLKSLPYTILALVTICCSLDCLSPIMASGIPQQPTKAEPTVLVKGSFGVVRECLATGTEVYWIEEHRDILHVNRDKGGFPMPFLRSNIPIEAVTADNSGFYYVRQNPTDLLERGEPKSPAELKRVEGGEKLTSLLTFELGTKTFVATDSSSIYLFVLAEKTDGTILRIPKTGGTPKPLATKIFGAVSQFAIDEKNIYWLDPSVKAVYSAPKNGGERTKLFARDESSFEPEVMTADEGNLYVMTRGGEIYRIDKATGNTTRIYTGGGFEFYGLSILADKNRLYWVEPHKIMAMDKNQLNPITLYPRASAISCMTMDNEFFYWFEVGGTGLMKVAR